MNENLSNIAGSMLAHYTSDNVLTVKKGLGQKNIQRTMKYIQMGVACIHLKSTEERGG